MVVYLACVHSLEDIEILGVYTSQDVAISKIEKRMEELYESNEDYGVYSQILKYNVDDIDDEDYF